MVTRSFYHHDAFRGVPPGVGENIRLLEKPAAEGPSNIPHRSLNIL